MRAQDIVDELGALLGWDLDTRYALVCLFVDQHGQTTELAESLIELAKEEFVEADGDLDLTRVYDAIERLVQPKAVSAEPEDRLAACELKLKAALVAIEFYRSQYIALSGRDVYREAELTGAQELAANLGAELAQWEADSEDDDDNSVAIS